MAVIKAREREVALLARLIRAEAEGEGKRGMLLVGNVGINRLRANCLDFIGIRTIQQMVFQPHAFESVSYGYFYQKSRSREKRIALRCINGERHWPAKFSLWFFRPEDDCPSSWYDQPLLSGIKIAIIGGDTRQLEIIHNFLDLDATVKLIGFENMQTEFERTMNFKLDLHVLKHIDSVILPAAGADESGIVESAFSQQELRIASAHVRSLPKHAKIYTGSASDYLKNVCSNHQIEIVELFERPGVSIYNSIPTAEGAILMAIQNTDITIPHSQCLVLGIRQTGIALSQALWGLGEKVKVGDDKDENLARAYQLGFDSFYLNDLDQQIAGVDLLFNTIPAMVVTDQIKLGPKRFLLPVYLILWHEKLQGDFSQIRFVN